MTYQVTDQMTDQERKIIIEQLKALEGIKRKLQELIKQQDQREQTNLRPGPEKIGRPACF